jgi:hypothetical protein
MFSGMPQEAYLLSDMPQIYSEYFCSMLVRIIMASVLTKLILHTCIYVHFFLAQAGFLRTLDAKMDS